MSPAPAIPLTRLYDFMRSMSGEERLDFAEHIAEQPRLFAGWAKRSLGFYRRFPATREAFHPPRRELPSSETVREIRRGYDLTVLLADRPHGRWWEVEGRSDLTFWFVDYELAPFRKTRAARKTNDPPAMKSLRADLLLVGSDGVPIVGEVKSATSTSVDTDPVLALVQGLTACAQLHSPQQIERLQRAYPQAQFRDLGELDLFLIVVKPAEPSEPTYQKRLYAAAKKLGPILAAEANVPARRIAFIEAQWDGQLRLRLGS